MNKSHKGKVTDGKFIPENSLEFKMGFAHLEGKEVEVIIKKKGRSKVRQYRYLYGVVYKLIADHTGFSTYYVDIYMKTMFYFDVVNSIRVPRAKSSDSFTTKEFTDYIDNVRKWSLEFLGVRIPEANEVGME
jgi:hypothetical protein